MSWVLRTKGGKVPPTEDFDNIPEDEIGIILVYGKNNFGKKIYTYIELPIRKTKKLLDKLTAGGAFVPSEFGKVVAAGIGEPSPEVEQEMGEGLYTLKFEAPRLPNMPAIPKKWDN